MNKLYHLFDVADYKGGELYCNINLTLEEVVELIIDYYQWDDLLQYIIDNELDKSDLNYDELEKTIPKANWIDYLTDNHIIDFSQDILYPGNTYAYDTYSDYKCYTTNKKGELVEVNPIKDPEFCNTLRKKWKEYYEEN